eukprot:TRINITY_DN42577_c0_g1_i1.p1 TRINITY_DN42577_c0_g1~~TRINITY_DN42577_c0_g1_i1.p1  ORF type:complete len:521 (+),score=102.51 TRINITY_DN42577_c0_g1_i1:53-1564(+)
MLRRCMPRLMTSSEWRDLNRKTYQEWVARMRLPAAADELDRAFSLERRRIRKLVERGDEGEVARYLEKLETQVTRLDPAEDEEFNKYECHFCAWGTWVHANPAVYGDLFKLCGTTDFQLIRIVSAILARTIQWTPEVLPDLVEKHFHTVVTAVNRTSRDTTPAGTSAFLHSLVLLNELFHGATPTPALLKMSNYPFVKWWRMVIDDHGPAIRECDNTLLSFNSFLLYVLMLYPEKVSLLEYSDLLRCDKYMEYSTPLPGGTKPDTLATVKRNSTVTTICEIISLKADAEDYVFLTQAVEKGWVVRLATELRKLKRLEGDSMTQYGMLVGMLLRASGAFAIRWPMLVAEAEIPKLAIDKLKVVLGYLHIEYKKEPSTLKDLVIETLPAVTGILRFLGAFSRGELEEQRHSPAAYNCSRVTALRHSHLPSLLCTILRQYSLSGASLDDVLTVITLLLNYHEQYYDIADVGLFQALVHARNTCGNRADEERILVIMKRVDELCVVG